MSAAAVPAPATAEGPDPIAALHQRLRSAAGVLGLGDVADRDPERASSVLFDRLVEHVHARADSDALWLLMTAMSGAMPTSDEVLSALRTRELTRRSDFGRWLLERTYAAAAERGSADLEMDVVTAGVVVDVDFSARNELHTGIQRVVRETLPRWQRAHDFTLVAWTDPGGAMRRLARVERERVLDWHARTPGGPERSRTRGRDRLVVPWHCTVLLPENPAPEHCPALAALSLYSGSTVSLIGYDCIPAISPELIHEGLPDRFMRYLLAVKHAARVVGISAAASREFRGFATMLGAQGLTGPTVVECPLPVEVPPGDPVRRANPPLVVAVGSFEPRKNQLTVLHAAEHLWREGLDFRLEFIGGGGWPTEFDTLMSRLTAAGRPVRRRTAIEDAEMWRTLRSARFTVFLSLHEGFGLPVAESLACGTPCLTSDFGATREIADEGGALVVDPFDDDAVIARFRQLLTDDALVERLTEEARGRPSRTWDDYAGELWEAMMPAPSDPGPRTRTAPR